MRSSRLPMSSLVGGVRAGLESKSPSRLFRGASTDGATAADASILQTKDREDPVGWGCWLEQAEGDFRLFFATGREIKTGSTTILLRVAHRLERVRKVVNSGWELTSEGGGDGKLWKHGEIHRATLGGARRTRR